MYHFYSILLSNFEMYPEKMLPFIPISIKLKSIKTSNFASKFSKYYE